MSRVLRDTVELVSGLALDAAAIYTGQPTLFKLGTGLFLAGLGDLLTKHNGNPQGMSTNPISPWEVIYGTAAVSGKVLYLSESGDSDKQLSFVYALAAHPCQELVAVYLNGKRVVYWTDSGSSGVAGLANTPIQDNINFASVTRNGSVVHIRTNPAHPFTYPLMEGDFLQVVGFTTDETVNGTWPINAVDSDGMGFWYTCGGSWQGTITGTDFGHVQTVWPDWKGKVYLELTLNGQDGVNPFPSLTTESGGQWNTYCSFTGKTMARLKFQYDPNLFANGVPSVTFVVKGYNNIYDPRLGDPTVSGAYGWTDNSALCIADFLQNKVWGYASQSSSLPGPTWGVELPYASWQNAANICDETVSTIYGTEPRYKCDLTFPISNEVNPGVILKNMLTSCAGRLIFESGLFQLQPAGWTGLDIYLGDGQVVVNADNPPYPYTTSNASLCLTSGVQNFNAPAIWPQAVTPGDTITIQTLRGKVNAAYHSELCDADGYTAANTGDGLATLLNGASVPGLPTLKDGALIGAFLDGSGNIVGHPFYIGTAGTTQTVPSGASQLSMGVCSDNWQYGVAGYFIVNVTSKLLGASIIPTIYSHTHEITATKPQHFNAVRIQHISPSYRWQQANAPAWLMDTAHGYSTDTLLAADNGDRRYLNVQLPCTTSVSAAQRIGKIMLLRTRHMEKLTFTSSLGMYILQPLTTMALTFPDESLVRFPGEVTSFSLVPADKGLSCQWTVEGPISADDYVWSTSEELPLSGATGYGGVTSSTLGTVAPPTSISVSSGSGTSVVTASGVSTAAISIVWTPPADSYVTNGGSIQARVSTNGGSTWTAAGTFDPNSGVATLTGFSDGQTVMVQLQSVNLAGASSGWVNAGTVTVSSSPTSLAPSGISTTGATAGQVLEFNGSAPVWATLSAGGTPITEAPSGSIPGTSFTLSYSPIAGSFNLYLNGVWQPPTTYTQTGTSLTLSTATISGDTLFVTYTH